MLKKPSSLFSSMILLKDQKRHLQESRPVVLLTLPYRYLEALFLKRMELLMHYFSTKRTVYAIFFYRRLLAESIRHWVYHFQDWKLCMYNWQWKHNRNRTFPKHESKDTLECNRLFSAKCLKIWYSKQQLTWYATDLSNDGMNLKACARKICPETMPLLEPASFHR